MGTKKIGIIGEKPKRIRAEKPKYKEFKTTQDLLKDEYFQNRVKFLYEDLVLRRRTRPDPKPGYKYNRDWYDRMRSKGMLSAKFFLENIESVWIRKSGFSAEIRGVLEHVCNQAARETIAKFKKPEEKIPKKSVNNKKQ